MINAIEEFCVKTRRGLTAFTLAAVLHGELHSASPLGCTTRVVNFPEF